MDKSESSTKVSPKVIEVYPPTSTKTSLIDELFIFLATLFNYAVFPLLLPLFLCLFIYFIRWILTGEWLSALVVVGFFVLYHYLGGNKKYQLSGNGRPWNALKQSSLYKYNAKYFPVSLVKTAELDPKGKYLFGVHPHSIIPTFVTLGMMTQGCGWSKLFPGIDLRGLAASSNFNLPIWKDIYLALGYIDAGYKPAISSLREGHSLIVLPGGEQEMLLAKPGDNTIVLKNRKGFVRLAIEGGASLVPVYAFGANDTYDEYNFSKRFNAYLSKKFRVVIPIVYGRWRSLYPYRKPVHLVVGSPIEIQQKKAEDITEEEVDRIHAQYVKALEDLFEEHKAAYGGAQQKLVIKEAAVGHHHKKKKE